MFEQNKQIIKLKQVVELAMLKKIAADTAKTKCFEALADLEELLALH